MVFVREPHFRKRRKGEKILYLTKIVLFFSLEKYANILKNSQLIFKYQLLKTMNKKILPKGIQDFSEIRNPEFNYLYVDKTKEIIDMIRLGKNSFFSRPRRFGKSLTLSTMEALFKAKKELFKGLYAENNWNWEKSYPVILFDFSDSEISSINDFKEYIIDQIEENLEEFEIKREEFEHKNISTSFTKALKALNKKTNKKIVFLVDEYDFPLVHSLNNLKKAKALREVLGDLYSVLKKRSKLLHYVLISGVSKFIKLSLFSRANHLEDLTTNQEISTICGYTHKEVLHNFKSYLDGINLEEMKHWYNGYNYLGEPLYNPYDILFLFSSKLFKNYWWETGTPTLLIEQLKKEDFYIPNFESELYDETLLNSFDIENINSIALFWQSGYLTFDKVVKDDGFIKYKMKYPNIEVKRSLNALFLETLTEDKRITKESKSIKEALKTYDANIIKTKLNTLFASLSHHSYTKNNIARYEGYYTNILYAFFYFLNGYKASTEISTNKGRIDLTLEAKEEIFIIEIKVNKNIDSAINQIKEKGYFEKYQNSKKDIYLLAITFSEDSKNIKDLKIEKI